MKLKLLTLIISLIGIVLALIFLVPKSPRTISAPPVKSISENQAAPKQIEAQDPAPNDSVTVEISKLQAPIFMYHYVREYNVPTDKIGTNLSVSPQNFANQLDQIRQAGYQTVTFSEIEKGQLPAKPIILTFDDGYQDFYSNAYPELKKRQMNAVGYIITDKIGQNGYMTSDEIKELANYGIEIGSHTVSHPDLSSVPNSKAETEMSESKSALEKIIGKPVISLCYPSGKYNNETPKIAAKKEYHFATTTKPGLAIFADPYELKRQRIENGTDISRFIVK